MRGGRARAHARRAGFGLISEGCRRSSESSQVAAAFNWQRVKRRASSKAGSVLSKTSIAGICLIDPGPGVPMMPALRLARIVGQRAPLPGERANPIQRDVFHCDKSRRRRLKEDSQEIGARAATGPVALQPKHRTPLGKPTPPTHSLSRSSATRWRRRDDSPTQSTGLSILGDCS
jgi:hypothetical protein